MVQYMQYVPNNLVRTLVLIVTLIVHYRDHIVPLTLMTKWHFKMLLRHDSTTTTYNNTL